MQLYYVFCTEIITPAVVILIMKKAWQVMQHDPLR